MNTYCALSSKYGCSAELDARMNTALNVLKHIRMCFILLGSTYFSDTVYMTTAAGLRLAHILVPECATRDQNQCG